MPELPEVETIARALREGGRGGPSIVGWRVSAVHLNWPRTLAYPDPYAFVERIHNQVITGVSRRGKFLLIGTTRDFLLFHLRMTGDLRVEPGWASTDEKLPFLPHDRLVVEFDHGMRMAFNDARKFGRAWLVPDPQMVLSKLGPEPFDPALTAEVFYERLRRHKRQIKPLLLDQSFIAGLGNIYTDEALYLARIHPLRIARTLSFEQSLFLFDAIRAVLSEGIRRNGASFDWAYRGGEFNFQVYQRTGEPCPNCGTPISRSTVGQRGTHFCPTCQPA